MKKNSEKKFMLIEHKIKKIMVEYLMEEENADVDAVTNLDELAINSIDALELLILIEQEFQIEIADEDLNMELLSDLEYLTDYVLDRVSDSYFDEK